MIVSERVYATIGLKSICAPWVVSSDETCLMLLSDQCVKMTWKLHQLKGTKETKEPLYTKNSGQGTEPPEPEKIHHDLIVALLEEFRKLREALKTTGKKQLKLKPRFCNNLFRCTETLLDVLQAEPEETSLKEWPQTIARKLPTELREPRQMHPTMDRILDACCSESASEGK